MAEWTFDDLEKLRSLWEKGLSANKIAAEIDRTRNSIIGMSHRLGLPARENPIKRRPPGAEQPPAARRRPKVNPDAKAQRNRLAAARHRAKKAGKPLPDSLPDEAPKKVTAPKRERLAVVVDQAKVGKFRFDEVVEARTCLWPFGDRPHMTFCGEARDGGASYCCEHARRAFRVAA